MMYHSLRVIRQNPHNLDEEHQREQDQDPPPSIEIYIIENQCKEKLNTNRPFRNGRISKNIFLCIIQLFPCLSGKKNEKDMKIIEEILSYTTIANLSSVTRPCCSSAWSPENLAAKKR
jgi:hypothetical protein